MRIFNSTYPVPPDRQLRFRWIHRFWAGLVGYFWWPCPLCGQPFSGGEWADGMWVRLLEQETGGGTAICPCHDVKRWVEIEPGVFEPDVLQPPFY